MKKIAVIALSLSLASSAAFAQEPGPTASGASDVVGGIPAPEVVIVGGFGASGIVLGAFGLLLLAGLGGSANVSATNTSD